MSIENKFKKVENFPEAVDFDSVAQRREFLRVNGNYRLMAERYQALPPYPCQIMKGYFDEGRLYFLENDNRR